MARIADGSQGRHNGKAIALTTLSPVVRDRWLGFWLGVVKYIPPLGRPLAELSFIHYGRWTVLEAVPARDGSGTRAPLESRYLLFESNYNGGLDEYLDTFTSVIPHRLARLWGCCFQFEETVQRADYAEGEAFPAWAFRRYVAANELRVLHFYAAYPEATMIDVRQALAIAALRPDDTRRKVPLVIGPQPERPTKWATAKGHGRALWSAISGRYGVNPFALLTPVREAAAKDLFTRLSDKWVDERSPLKALTDTHYARLVQVPRDLMDLGQRRPDDLGLPYLLYTSNHCGSAEEHITRLRTQLGEVADDIWGHCPGYPGHDKPAEFDDWAGRHKIDTRYFVPGYAPHEVAYVTQALAERENIRSRL
jgi:hypothetical protein